MSSKDLKRWQTESGLGINDLIHIIADEGSQRSGKKGKERKGKERKGKERKGKEMKKGYQSMIKFKFEEIEPLKFSFFSFVLVFLKGKFKIKKRNLSCSTSTSFLTAARSMAFSLAVPKASPSSFLAW
jgi:hypothetical protein